MTDRRYDDDETRRIFEEASRAPGTSAGPASSLTPAVGFTLAELQEIGSEAGIDPARIAEVARGLDVRRTSVPTAVRRVAGIPIGVSRTVSLPASFDDDDWNRLVVDLRETFDARGRIRVEGAFREWSNGNLQALVEPTDEGFQLRLRTVKGSAAQAAIMSAVGLFVAVLMTVGLLTKDALDVKWMLPAFFAVLSLGNIAATGIRLPIWARTRARQMEEVAARALLRAGDGDADRDGDGDVRD